MAAEGTEEAEGQGEDRGEKCGRETEDERDGHDNSGEGEFEDAHENNTCRSGVIHKRGGETSAGHGYWNGVEGGAPCAQGFGRKALSRRPTGRRAENMSGLPSG